MKQNKQEKQPKVKNLLLQTYFTSLLSLVLCVSMFFGTSYAWFSSEVNNTVNEIYIGTLDVGLFKQDGEDWLNLADSQHKLFGSSIRWEPGSTYLETIRVENEGDLAFKYMLYFTDGKVDTSAARSGENGTKYFDVWVYEHKANETIAPSEINEENGWTSVNTLNDLLATPDGKPVHPVLSGQMDAKDGEQTEAQTHTYTIAVHMREDATSDLMKQKITMTVKLVAYQLAAVDETGELIPPNSATAETEGTPESSESTGE